MVPGALMLKLLVENLRTDRAVLATRWDLLLGIVAEFSVLVDERHFYYEDEFPVVEFAARLSEWLARVGEATGKPDFAFESMESEEPCLVSFRRASDGWRLSSRFQRYEEERVFSCEEVIEASKDFIAFVAAETRRQIGVDIEQVLTVAPTHTGE
jgi:hypothetical protein